VAAETVGNQCRIALLGRALIITSHLCCRTERSDPGVLKTCNGEVLQFVRIFENTRNLNTGVRMIQPNAAWETPEEEQEEEDEDLEEERKITEEKEDEEDEEDDEDDEEI
jgi:hypothetical protein